MMEKETLLFGAVLIFVSAVPNSQTKCPATGFTEGLQSTINCTVDTKYYDSCRPFPTVVTFHFWRGVNLQTPWCTLRYTSCNTTGQTQTACHGCSCKCLDNNRTTNINKYSLTFIPQASYNGGSFNCEIQCVVPSSPETRDDASCANVQVAPKPTTTPADGEDRDNPSTTPRDNNTSDSTSTTTTGTESGSLSILVIGLGVAGGVCVVMAAVGVYCIRKLRSGGLQDAPPANIPPANAPQDKAPPAYDPEVAGSAGPSTDQASPTTPDDDPDESNVDGSEASEATEVTASEVGED